MLFLFEKSASLIDKSVLFLKMSLEQKSFTNKGRSLRQLAKSHLSMGSTGVGQLDGEMSSPVIFRAIQYILNSQASDDGIFTAESFGLELGSGTGVTSYLLSYGLNLRIVGFEINSHRSLFCWSLQKFLLKHPDHEELAKRCMFLNTDAYTGLKDLFGINMPIQNAVMAFTFSEGWHPTDINNMLKYLNDYASNLQWIICDMDSTILRDCGFLGRFIHSFCASGRMANSTNSRTIYVHRVEA